MLCVVFNTCGLGGQDHSGRYADGIQSVLDQDAKEVRVVVSDCCSPPAVREQLRSRFGTAISYSFIDDPLPVLATFNWSVFEAVKSFGTFDAYVYLDSGITFRPHADILSKLLRRYREREAETGMVAVPVDADNSSYASIGRVEPFGGGEVPIGEHINLHCLLIGERLRRAYDGKGLPDAFGGWGSEGAYPYLCSALRMRFLLTTDTPPIEHLPGMDGSMRTLPAGWAYGMFRRNTTIHEIAREGAPFGFGFEEFFNPNYAGDRTQFDAQGFSISDDLHRFLREKLFLTKAELDYETVKGIFIP